MTSEPKTTPEPKMTPEKELAQKLLPQLRPDFEGREATALQFAELLLDAVEAALPLTHHAPAELALPQLELLGQQLDVFSWDGTPGWDVVLARGLGERTALPPGPSIAGGLGAFAERTQQRGELKRRAQGEAAKLLAHGRAAELIPSHAAMLRLSACGMVFSLLQPAPDPDAGDLPEGSPEALTRDLDERGEGFLLAQDEWLATLMANNPLAAAEPQFRTFFASLSQSLRAVRALHVGPPYDLEAVLAGVVSWQPHRFPGFRRGAPSEWICTLCPPVDGSLAAEREAALSVFARLWFAKGASACALHALAALFTARCASAAALCEELAADRAAD
jgi:hypothetical protein